MSDSIPQKYIRGVKDVAGQYFDLGIPDPIAVELIRGDEDLQKELKDCGGVLADTASREMLAQVVIDHVMKDVGAPVNRDDLLDESGWHWPCYGSGALYRTEFDQKFSTAARAKGYILGRAWDAK